MPLTSSIAILSSLALLQSSPSLTLEETLQYCAKIEDSTDRLACFEGLAAAAQKPSQSAASKTEPVEETSPLPSTANENSSPVTAASPQETANDEKQAASKAPSQPRFVIMTEEEAREQKRAAKAAASPAKPRELYQATVLKSWRYSATNEQYVALKNGEIWKKIDRVKGRSIKDGLKVTLTPGAISGWLMKFDDKRPAIRVKLVK